MVCFGDVPLAVNLFIWLDFQGVYDFMIPESSLEKSGVLVKLQASVVCSSLEIKPGVGSIGICLTESDCHYKTIRQGGCVKADVK